MDRSCTKKRGAKNNQIHIFKKKEKKKKRKEDKEDTQPIFVQIDKTWCNLGYSFAAIYSNGGDDCSSN